MHPAPFAPPCILRPAFRISRRLALAILAAAVSLLPRRAEPASFLPAPDDKHAAAFLKSPSAQALDAMLRSAPAGRDFIAIDDMRFRVRPDSLSAGFALPGKWANGIVYYEFEPSIDAAKRQGWISGASQWSHVSNVVFRARTDEPNYIYVKESAGNWSEVGMIGGKQEMGIISWFGDMTVAHEAGHALGMWHEHQRSDRDDYVIVYEENIWGGYEGDFAKMETVNYGAYDFDSIMHYGRLAFSDNGLNTLEPKPAFSSWLYIMGHCGHLSVLDAWGMAQRYGGSGRYRPPDGVAAERGASHGSATVSWNAVPGAKGYILEYGDNAGGPPYAAAQPGSPAPGANVGNVTSQYIQGLARGTRYYFSLKATNGYITSDYSKQANVLIPPLKQNDPYEPNNEIDTACDLTARKGQRLTEISGLANLWDLDYYKITLGPGQTRLWARCEYAWADGRIGMQVWQSGSWQPLAERYVQGKNHQIVDLTGLAPGDYFILIIGQWIGNTYDLWWTDTPPETAAESGPAGWPAYR